MELRDLNKDERLALLGLIVQMIGADSGRSPEEMQEFREIADEMGRQAFDDAFRAAVAAGCNNRDTALTLARKVERPDAQQILHTVLVDLAQADFLSEEERDLIRTVARIWGVQTRI